MQLIWCLLWNFYLNMFQASLCPSSAEQECALPRTVLCTGCDGCGCVELGCQLCALWRLLFIINIRLVASCWFLSLHPTFMMHGHKSLKKVVTRFASLVSKVWSFQRQAQNSLLDRQNFDLHHPLSNKFLNSHHCAQDHTSMFVEISGSCCGAVEVFALLGCCAALSPSRVILELLDPWRWEWHTTQNVGNKLPTYIMQHSRWEKTSSLFIHHVS